MAGSSVPPDGAGDDERAARLVVSRAAIGRTPQPPRLAAAEAIDEEK
ncbi:hypothetical protein M2302_004553 [Micromonospora sp. A200]|nr:hypothetical protein [Micromonospora sp. A200]